MMRQANVPPEINSEGFIFHHRAGKDHECNMNAGDILQARLQRLRSVSLYQENMRRWGDRGDQLVRTVGAHTGCAERAPQALILPRP